MAYNSGQKRPEIILSTASNNEDEGITNPAYSAANLDMMKQIESALNRKLSSQEAAEQQNRDYNNLLQPAENMSEWSDRCSFGHIYDTPEPHVSRNSTFYQTPARLTISEAPEQTVGSINIAYYRDKRLLQLLCIAVVVLLLTSIITICLLIIQGKSVDSDQFESKIGGKKIGKNSHLDKDDEEVLPWPIVSTTSQKSLISTTEYELCKSGEMPVCAAETELSSDREFEDVKIVEFRHISKFNYSSLIDVPFDKPIKGDRFSTTHNNLGFTWQIWLYPSIHRRISKNWEHDGIIGAYLKYVDGPRKSINTTFTLFVRDLNGAFTNDMTVVSRPIEKQGRGWGFAKFLNGSLVDLIEKSLVMGLNFNLEIGVTVGFKETVFDPVALFEEGRRNKNNDRHLTLSNDSSETKSALETFKSVTCDETVKGADFLMISKEKLEFHCHKKILAHKSPYFRHIFQNSTSSKVTKVVFPDYSASGLRETLQFMYMKCTSSDLETVAVDVVPIADAFRLPDLLLKCEEALTVSISRENCIDMLNLAWHYDFGVLKNVAINFILDNWSPLTNGTSTQEFPNFASTEMYQKLVEVASLRIKLSTFV